MNKLRHRLPEIRKMADEIGEFIQHFGFKRVHGRIWAYLALCKEPLDAAGLMKRLGISKALVSMSLNDLLELGAIHVTGKSPRGTLLYRINPDVMDVLLGIIRSRERKMMYRILSAHKALKSISQSQYHLSGICPEKVRMLGTMIEAADEALDLFVSKLQFDLSSLKKFHLGG